MASLLSTMRNFRSSPYTYAGPFLRRTTAIFTLERFILGLATVSLIFAKLTRIWAHFDALDISEVFLWGPSFYFQDTIVLLFLQCITGRHLLATAFAGVLTFAFLTMSAMTVSFYLVSGSMIKWHNADLATDPAARHMALAYVGPFTFVFVVEILLAFLLQKPCADILQTTVDGITWVVRSAYNRLRGQITSAKYTQLQQQEKADLEADTSLDVSEPGIETTPTSVRVFRALALIWLVLEFLCTICHPSSRAIRSMSWTLPFRPLGEALSNTAPTLDVLLATSEQSTIDLTNRTSMGRLPSYPWLPSEPQPGFQDWYSKSENKTKDHYNVKKDPLKINNLDQPLLPSLREANIHKKPIRHILLLTMETMRKDVFPLKESSYTWKKVASSYPDGKIDEGIEENMKELTRNAEFLTGESAGDISELASKLNLTRRGGLNFKNAVTASTYTLKSILSSHCGLMSPPADMNKAYNHHFYQPCLPHIFSVLNNLDCSSDDEPTWNNTFLQATRTNFDHQYSEMEKFGFADDEIIDGDYLKKPGHEFPPVHEPDVNYFGMEDKVLKDYFKATFKHAEELNQRAFVSHLTSTTHDPWKTPKRFPTFDFSKSSEVLTHYLNSIHYSDTWLHDILKTLEELGVAEETLIVAAGDHGMAISEKDVHSQYGDPHVATMRIPIVLSHGGLQEMVDINEPISTISILPTILDLLIETNSLPACAKTAAKDLLHNYEGQSLIRSLRPFSPKTGQGDWQFSVINPGGSVVSVRDARKPNWKVVVPIRNAEEWWFTDLTTDPNEMSPLKAFDKSSFLKKIAARPNSTEALNSWVREAIDVTTWWTNDTLRRWRVD